jgi:uncharacterized membrane protein YjgN (DUF898 family)
MSVPARWLMAFIAWSATTAVLAPICFFVAVILAGPHSSMLPSFLQPAVVVLAWLVLLIAPPWLARRVWRRTGGAT